MSATTILHGDALAQLRTIRSGSVQCVVTSPPYWSLRDYQVDGQIGLESTFPEFLERLVAVFSEVHRVLREDGVCWVNMGDSYATASRGMAQGGLKAASDVYSPRKNARAAHSYTDAPQTPPRSRAAGFRHKEIIGQPWRLAFALQDAGWLLRQDIIWHKTQPMPESAVDRCTKAHEYIFLLTKTPHYFWSTAAAKEPCSGTAHARGKGVNPKARNSSVGGWATGPGSHEARNHSIPGKKSPRPRQNESFSAAVSGLVTQRNWRSVWSMPTQAFKGGHTATFPTHLAHRCIVAGSRAGDVVLDPFGGSGTTGLVARGLGRRSVLIELSPESVAIARNRIGGDVSGNLPEDLVREPYTIDFL